MTANPQFNLRASLRDVVDFLIEEIELARSPEDRLAAIDVAQGVIPFLRSQLKKDQQIAARFVLALTTLIDSDDAGSVWMEHAKDPEDVFSGWADDVIDRLNDLKQFLDGYKDG
jgi:hypothetical protein